MNIISALMKTDARLAYEYRWLVCDKVTEEWVVYDNSNSWLRIRGNISGANVIGRTKSQDQAIEWLLEEE